MSTTMLSRAWSQALLGTAAALALCAASTAADAQSRTRLTVYTALENEQLAPFKAAIEADVKDIEIAWIRDSTGVIAARLLAEKDNPRADIVLGLAATNLMVMEANGMLHPYAPAGADKVRAGFKDTKSPPTWVGMDAYLGVICFNKAEGEKRKIAQPASWADLLKSEFKGQVVMPNPASSGTGYLTVVAWLQTMGEAKAWEFMDALHQNVAVYTHSGSAPCRQAGQGEYTAGMALDMTAAGLKTRGAPLEAVVPSEGVGFEIEATAIMKGTKNLAAAQKLADWLVTPKANELYRKYYEVTAIPGVGEPTKNYPAGAEAKMIKNDFVWSAANRDRILAEWTKRYDGKSAPR